MSDKFSPVKVGLLVFGESRQREEVFRSRREAAARETARLVGRLESAFTVWRPGPEVIRGKRDALAAVRAAQGAGVEVVILYISMFTSAALVAHTAGLLQMPSALAGNAAPETLSALGFLAAGGALDLVRSPCRRICGDAAGDGFEALRAFLAGAGAAARLRGETFGCIGGRALGISPGVADPAQWEQVFGVDTEHIDQFELVRRAEAQEPQKVRQTVESLCRRGARCAFNDSSFTPAHLEKQVRSFLALQELWQVYELDFGGVKCQPDLSNGFCLQCVPVSLMNDRQTVCSCEADADGALTMRILQFLARGEAVTLNDIIALSGSRVLLANCGAMAPSWAGTPEDPEGGWSRLTLGAHSFGAAGGGSVQFIVPSGIKVTFARLFRRQGRYCLGVFSGRTTEPTAAEYSPGLRVRPVLAAEVALDEARLLETFGSNHVLAARGCFKAELREFARICDLDFFDYDRG